MVKNPEALRNIQSSWETVHVGQAIVKTNLNAGAIGFIPQADEFRNLAHNLVLLFAFSVIEDTLKQLRDEGFFSSKGSELKKLMEASKDVVPWQNYSKVDEGRDKRNAVAHRRQFLIRADCWLYIDAVESELIAWGILSGPIRKNYTITVTPTS